MDLLEIKNAHRDRLLSYPNVTGVGIGRKIRDGKDTGVAAIKVYVSKKVKELEPAERIPESLDGVPTDVEVLSNLRAR